ncbi:MAG: hypothetical protein AB1478_02985 [Nitrospirota bacterium]
MIVITVLISAADILAIRADFLGILLDKRTNSFNPILYLLSKFLDPLEFMPVFVKDFFYLADYLIIYIMVVMTEVFDEIVVLYIRHHFLTNLNADKIPRITDEAAATTESTL